MPNIISIADYKQHLTELNNINLEELGFEDIYSMYFGKKEINPTKVVEANISLFNKKSKMEETKMAKESVNEVLTAIAAKIDHKGKKKLNQFNRSNFDRLINAAASDPEFTSQVAIIKKGEFQGYKEIACGKEFRKWLRGVVEKAGIDRSESGIVESSDFNVGNLDWMYDFFAEVLWLYLEGNKFALPKKEDFDATLALKDVDEVIKVGEMRKPGGPVIGNFETTKKAHKVLTAKSSCPKYLQSRRMV